MGDVFERLDNLDQSEECSKQSTVRVMHLLPSTDLTFEPTKLICERYPVCLAARNHKLSELQYLKYTKQFAFQKLATTYESEPANYSRQLALYFLSRVQKLAIPYESEPANCKLFETTLSHLFLARFHFNCCIILESMFDLQVEEQPPPEIMHGIASGLKFDENEASITSDSDSNLGIDNADTQECNRIFALSCVDLHYLTHAWARSQRTHT